MTQALYLRTRPQTWNEVIGQDHVIDTLHNAVVAGRFVHAFLFAGSRGTGKTSSARILAKAVNCLAKDLIDRPCNQCSHCTAVNQGRFLDLIEIDAASNTSVDDVRDLREKIYFSPNQGRYKVYIIDEVHMLSNAAFNALLKTLEEPPAHAIFILATTEVHKIPSTVISRCQRHEFRRIAVKEIVTHLEALAESEELEADSEAIHLIARQSTGSLRDAISLLDQLSATSQRITLDWAQSVLGTATNQAVIEVVDAILSKDSARGLDIIHRTLDAGSDTRQFTRQIIDYLRNLMLVSVSRADHIEATQEIRAQMARQAQALSMPEILSIIRAFNRAANETRSSWQPSLPLELAFIETVEIPPFEVTSPRKIDAPSNKTASRSIPSGVTGDKPVRRPTTEVVEDEIISDPEIDSLLQKILQNWHDILTTVRRQNPKTQALLNSCKPLGIKNGTLILGFSSDFVKSKMELGENIDIINQVMTDILSETVPIRCITTTKRSNTIPSGIDQDGMVATAVRDLGGEIINGQR